MKLCVSDAHEGLKGRYRQGLGLPLWQRCTVHFVRDMHQHCRPQQRGMVSAALREVFQAESYEQARERATVVIERLAPAVPKVAELLEEAEEDLIAFYRFPAAHWSKLRSTNPLERVNREVRAPRRHRRHLPQRQLGDPPRRRPADRAKRPVVADQPPLPLRGVARPGPRGPGRRSPGGRRARGGASATSRVKEPARSYTTTCDLTPRRSFAGKGDPRFPTRTIRFIAPSPWTRWTTWSPVSSGFRRNRDDTGVGWDLWGMLPHLLPQETAEWNQCGSDSTMKRMS